MFIFVSLFNKKVSSKVLFKIKNNNKKKKKKKKKIKKKKKNNIK